jgi:hypothetical protein
VRGNFAAQVARAIEYRHKSPGRGRRAAPQMASDGAAKTNRLHRFVRFALRVARQRAVSGGSTQKIFALVNLLLPTLFSGLKASSRHALRGVEETEKQIALRSKKPQFIGTSATRKKTSRMRA